jgi:hypothetical protein
MIFKIINNNQFEILESINKTLDNISDEIVRLQDGQIVVLRNSSELLGYSYLKSNISENESITWRTNSYKKKWLSYHYNLLNILKLQLRDSKIEKVLQPKSYDEQMILAC